MRYYNTLQKLWHHQAKDKRRCDLVQRKESENLPVDEMNQILKLLEDNDNQLLCNKCKKELATKVMHVQMTLIVMARLFG